MKESIWKWPRANWPPLLVSELMGYDHEKSRASRSAVKACLDELGLSVAEAAAALHITRQQLHNIVAGRSSVTPEMAIRFEKAFGSTADTWLRMQVNYDLAQARKRTAEIEVERLTPKVA